MNILERIAHIRRETIVNEGYTLGSDVPDVRDVPLVPFGKDPFVICEIKRRSPSKGQISEITDPVKQASLYVEKGIRNISVLTEEDHFGGSLKDLMAVKKAFPEIAVLRKDFLLEKEDVDVSYRAGADAILLIAAMLDKDKLKELYEYAVSLDLSVLMEVHNEEEIEKVRPLRPRITGINCRNLKTFKIDQALPLKLKKIITWETQLVYESGISSFNDAIIPFSGGFSGILVGESVVRDIDLIDSLIKAETLKSSSGFWTRLFNREKPGIPLVKICGITNRPDADEATRLGADILGFVMAESPRRAGADFIRSLSDLDILKVAVVVTDEADPDNEVMRLLEEGHLDAVQFHGNESPLSMKVFSYPCYKGLRLKDSCDTDEIVRYPGPRVLVDAYSRESYGGTGERISSEDLENASSEGPLWIAGGLSEENIRSVVDQFHPEMVDVSSKLESEKGKKDHKKMKSFFAELNNGHI
jgi:indole-3-glycerol phosphate synthase/phosphoribosylanthranilate isomerase